MNDGRIEANITLWREQGGWRMIIDAPRWVISDLAREITPHREIVILNHGGGNTGNNTMLLGVQEKDRKYNGDGLKEAENGNQSGVGREGGKAAGSGAGDTE